MKEKINQNVCTITIKDTLDGQIGVKLKFKNPISAEQNRSCTPAEDTAFNVIDFIKQYHLKG